MTRRDQIFALYISFENETTASDTLIAAKYLKQLLTLDAAFEKVDNENQILEKAKLELHTTIGEAVMTQMRNYVLKQKLLTTKSIQDNFMGINIVSNCDPSNHISDLSKTLLKEDLSAK